MGWRVLFCQHSYVDSVISFVLKKEKRLECISGFLKKREIVGLRLLILLLVI